MNRRMMMQSFGGGGGVNPFQDATIALSLRDLGLGATHVVRVRRDSDNTEQDFTATEITDGTLTSFCGAGNGFVSVWYDQEGTNDAEQSIASSQPKIVDTGALILENGKPIIVFDGVDDYLLTQTYMIELSQNDASLFVVSKASDSEYMIAEADSISPYSSQFIFGNLGRKMIWLNSNDFGTQLPKTQALSGFTWDSNTIKMRLNGVNDVLKSNLDINLEVFGYTSIGSRTDGTSSFFKGNIQEIISFKSDKTNELSDIDTNMNNYYNIY